jgi:hypothetical protein
MKAEGSVSANLGLILVCLGVGLLYYLKQTKREKFRITDIDRLFETSPVALRDKVPLRMACKSAWVKAGLMEESYLPGEEWFNRHDSR